MTPAQLCFQGFEAAPSNLRSDDENYFFALRPNGTAIDSIQRFQRLCERRGVHGTPLKPDNLHVSLHGFGPALGSSPTLLEAAMTAGALVVSAPFCVAFERALSFRHKKIKKAFVLRGRDDLIALEIFHQLLGVVMTKVGLGDFVAESFTPHVTLRYTPQMIAEHAVETISWTVNEFFLLRSLVGEAQHEVVGRWPLRG